MADQQKAPPLPPQVAAQPGAALGVQVVGGLVDQRVAALLQKQRRQQHAGLLAGRKAAEPPVQELLPQAQKPQFPLQLPVGGVAAGRRAGRLRHRGHRVGRRVREPPGLLGQADAAGVLLLAAQQPQQRGLAPAVAAGQAQLPAGVQLQVQIGKDVVVAAGPGKRQVGNGKQRHGRSPSCVQSKGRAAEGKRHPFCRPAFHRHAAPCPARAGTQKSGRMRNAACRRADKTPGQPHGRPAWVLSYRTFQQAVLRILPPHFMLLAPSYHAARGLARAFYRLARAFSGLLQGLSATGASCCSSGIRLLT